MISFRDRVYCPFYLLCKTPCDRSLTPQVKADAAKWWGNDNAPISVYAEFPECFVRFFEEVSE